MSALKETVLSLFTENGNKKTNKFLYKNECKCLIFYRRRLDHNPP